MAADRAQTKAFVGQNRPRYEQLMRRSLCLSNYNGSVNAAEEAWQLEFPAVNPSVTVLVLTPVTEGSASVR
jgi:hypothetical protein